MRATEYINEMKYPCRLENHYKYARIEIYAEDNMLADITIRYLRALRKTGAWDFSLLHYDGMNIITFKYNGIIAFLYTLSQLDDGCDHAVTSEWNVEPVKAAI